MKQLKLKSPLRNLSVYGSKGLIVIYGYDMSTGMYNVLEISRPVLAADATLKVKLLPQEYSASQISARKANMKTAYKDMELLHDKVTCIYGCIKLLDSFYLVLVTKATKCGSLAGHSIYTVDETVSIPLTFGMRSNPDETRYKAVLAGFDLTRHIYFCFSYDLTRSWQSNASIDANTDEGGMVDRVSCQSMFVWNSFALKPLLNSTDSSSIDAWCVPMIYGFVHQRNMQLAGGVSLKFILIARRSRHFAGTRYLRRGVDMLGHVANEVESEQIFVRSVASPGDVPRVASVVQCRGSIPLFWSHTNLYSPKPDVQLESDHAVRQRAAQHHFENLFLRYGYNVHVLNLVKQVNSVGEHMLGVAFKETCEVLNEMFQSKSRDIIRALNAPRPETANDDVEPEFLCEEKPPTAQGSPDSVDQCAPECCLPPPLHFIAYDFLNMAKQQHAGAAAGGAEGCGSEVPHVFRDLNRICEKIFPTIGFYVDPPGADRVSALPGGANRSMTFPLSQVRAGFESVSLDCDELELMFKEPVQEDDGTLLASDGGVGTGCPVELRQNGVMRTNCMDCLDRTNVAQFCFARVAIPRQLRALGINLTATGLQEVISLCMEIWAEHGDTIAIQYGGSGAMHKVDEQETTATGEREFVLTGGAKNAVVAVQRYYSNISTDFERQDSIDVLLGIFEPKKNASPIWEQRLRTENMREGVRGRRVSDMSDVIAKNERLVEELQNLAASASKEYADTIVETEEGDKSRSSRGSDSNALSRKIAGFRVLGLAGSIYHESFASVELADFYDIVEDFHIDNVKMEQVRYDVGCGIADANRDVQIRVFPFPLFSHAEIVRRRYMQAKREQVEREELACCVVPPLTAMEQLYENYISGDFMFSSSYINYGDVLQQSKRSGARVKDESSPAAASSADSPPPQSGSTPARRKQAELQEESQMNDVRSHASVAGGSMLDREMRDRPVSMPAKATARRESLQKQQVGGVSGGAGARRSSGNAGSFDQSSPQTAAANNSQKRSIFWPFRKTSVVSGCVLSMDGCANRAAIYECGQTEADVSNSTATAASTSVAESSSASLCNTSDKQEEAIYAAAPDLEYVVKRLDDVSR
jgi:hypothetical protein